jgi:malonate transporter
LPASSLEATASAPRGELLAQFPLFAISGAVMLAVFLFWYLFEVRFRRANNADASLQALTMAFPNLAGVGLPLLSEVLGASGAVPVAIVLASGSLIVSPLALVIVELNRREEGMNAARTSAFQICRAFGRAVAKPVVLAPACGFLLSLSDLKMGRIFDSCLLLIGQTAPGAALFLTGLILSSQSFRIGPEVVSATVVANIIRPLMTAAIVIAVPNSEVTFKISILLAAVPSGFFGILFAVNYRVDYATMGSMVMASTIFSAVTMATTIVLLYPNGS